MNSVSLFLKWSTFTDTPKADYPSSELTRTESPTLTTAHQPEGFINTLTRYFWNGTRDAANILRTPALEVEFQNTGLLKSPTSRWDESQASSLQAHQITLQWIKDHLDLPDERVSYLLGVSRQTVSGWRRGKSIADTKRRRLVAVRDLLESTLKVHGHRAQVLVWLDTPRGADGKTPAEYIASGDLDRARSLAVSMPSSRVRSLKLRATSDKQRERRVEIFDAPLLDDRADDILLSDTES